MEYVCPQCGLDPDGSEVHRLVAHEYPFMEREQAKTLVYWQEKAKSAEDERDRFKAEVKELRDWKASAMACYPPLQDIGKELDVGFGEPISDKILPGIRNLKAERDYYKKAIDNLLNHIDTCHKDDEDAQEIAAELRGFLQEEC